MAYLTIDDAPSARFGEKLDFLSSRGIAATFFVVGNQVAGREAGLLRALALGYELGNHSWSHPGFSSLLLAAAKEEIDRTDAALASLYAKAGRPWSRKRFRFPYIDLGGPIAAQVQDYLGSLGYLGPSGSAGRDTRVGFDQREYWLGKAAAPEGCDRPEGILARIDSCHPAEDDVILIHDHENTHELFFECIERYRRHGRSFSILD
jgi:Predicted xylanase/chitin deacetylase